MNFAVVKYGGKQHLVKEGQTLKIEGNLAEKPGNVELSEVLLLNVGEKLEVGTPLVAGAKIPAKILSIEKGTKIDVYKFKAKARYRKHTGFRPFVTVLEIGSFGSEKQSSEQKPTEGKKATKTTK